MLKAYWYNEFDEVYGSVEGKIGMNSKVILLRLYLKVENGTHLGKLETK